MNGTSHYATACDDMQLMIQADQDGELDAAASVVLAGHLRDCPGCAAMAQEMSGLSRALRKTVPVEPAPARLRATLEAHLLPPARIAPRLWRLRLPAFTFAAGAACAAAVLLLVPPAHPPADLAADLISGHIRSLQPGHLIDVLSSDRHTVKPWFEGKLDFAPPVADLSAAGYVLEGGRLDVIAGRSVAVLIYRHDKHPVNLFVWRDATKEAPGGSSRSGYALRHWDRDGLTFHVVSDLDPVELANFARLWQALP